MKASFRQYLLDRPTVKAIFVGTWRTDPHGALLTHFDETDHGWPPFMRIHPVIDWHYAEIWTVSFFFPENMRILGCYFMLMLTYVVVYKAS
jgi:3'-phosphoadenosine 5'-phosphosulfate sulfotransferase (PAPS reductase)/FAD synthetase